MTVAIELTVYKFSIQAKLLCYRSKKNVSIIFMTQRGALMTAEHSVKDNLIHNNEKNSTEKVFSV